MNDIDFPAEPNLLPPDYHKETPECQYESFSYDVDDVPYWLPCDCQDPANPWPERLATDGRPYCNCHLCSGKARKDRGRAPCEYAEHHCYNCHEQKYCRTIECLKEWENK